ncbi:MAG: hypothetical protein IJA57_01165 [Alistipes sp.]|nr:hypothetical protein [Alistipes sp.]
MTVKKSYKPIGGVSRAELFVVGDGFSVESVVEGGGIEVELIDDGSSYEELFISTDGLVSVQHTLTLTARRGVADEWLDKRFLELCAAQGVVARVLLSSGESLTVGWSERFGVEQALRLEQMHLQSGSKPTDEPRICLKLKALDTQSAIV